MTAEEELRNRDDSLAANRKYVEKCGHAPELVIGSENGPICCECWAIEEQSKAAQLESDLAATRQKLAEAQADCAAKADALRAAEAEAAAMVQALLRFQEWKKQGRVLVVSKVIEDLLAAALASTAGDALVKELERLRAENKENFEAWQTALNLAARVGNDCESLRAQRDQAVLLARELGERLQEECNIDDRTGKPRWSNTREALAKLQSLNPPTSDDTLKV